MSRPLDSISFGSLSALAALLALAVSLSACDEEQALTLRPVELVDPAPADPFETDPLLAPRALDCEDCALRRVELPGGEGLVARIRGEKERELMRIQSEAYMRAQEVRGEADAKLRLAPDVVESIELAAEGAVEGGVERYAVYALLDEAGREAWRRFAVAHARQFVLVEIGERPVDLVRPLGWSRGLRIGVFEDESAREAFVRALPFGRRPAREQRDAREAQRAP